MERRPSVRPHIDQLSASLLLLLLLFIRVTSSISSSDSTAVLQHGGSVVPVCLPAGLTGRIVDGVPGRRPPSAPVRLSPGRRPLPGLWGQRLLLQPQERRRPPAGFPPFEGRWRCSGGRRERGGRVRLQGPDGDDGEARHRGAMLPPTLQHLRPAELLQLTSVAALASTSLA